MYVCMYMCVCMNVCMYVCMCVYVVCMYVHCMYMPYIRMHAYLYEICMSCMRFVGFFVCFGLYVCDVI